MVECVFSLCVCVSRAKNVEKSAAYSKTFKGNDDGKVNSTGPRQIVGQNGMGPGSGYVQRYEIDKRMNDD